MAVSVVTHHLSFGNVAGVVNEVTGDGSTRTWETGLSNVMFYICITGADAHCLQDEIYLNSSANGTTKMASVHMDEADHPPDTGEVWYCLGIGKG